jgi:hypothetical protein
MDPHYSEKPDPDSVLRHQREKSDPDPHFSEKPDPNPNRHQSEKKELRRLRESKGSHGGCAERSSAAHSGAVEGL